MERYAGRGFSRMAMRRLKEAEEERTELLAKGWVMS
jgi:hypothetical protein